MQPGYGAAPPGGQPAHSSAEAKERLRQTIEALERGDYGAGGRDTPQDEVR